MPELENLTDEELRTLDYVLNYTPDTRIIYDIKNDIYADLEEVEDLVKIETKTDRYSNSYDVVSLKEQYKSNVRDLIEEKFGSLYGGDEIQKIREIFSKNPQLVKEVINQDESKVSFHRQNLHTQEIKKFLRDLESIGLGFIELYKTTTGNFQLRFERRGFPEGRADSIEKAFVSIKAQRKTNLNDPERWIHYISSKLGKHVDDNQKFEWSFSGRELALENRREYSPSEIKDNLAKEIMELDFGDENSDQIKTELKENLKELVRKDKEYFSVLDYVRSESLGMPTEESSLSSPVHDRGHYLEELKRKGLLLYLKEKEDEEMVNKFLITKEVMDILEDLKKRLEVESYPIDSRRKAQKIFNDLISNASKEVKIIDRYFDEKALKFIDSCLPKHFDLRVMVLTSEDQLNEEFKDKLDSLLTSNIYEIRTLGGDDLPHDRFMIIDSSKVWQLGHSFNGVGNDFSTIFSHSGEESGRYNEVFENLWEDSKGTE